MAQRWRARQEGQHNSLFQAKNVTESKLPSGYIFGDEIRVYPAQFATFFWAL
jgi:hypothetical protein